ncbi:type II toxin-antitoxin system RelE/ParE family toxin [Pedobacter steynii]|uniref:Plasmid stabilization system protein ParE n=1 Tax=Pedobacter steynii TaxID=430522 RepID=A0A1D7QEQ9_9SPHI|nr:type II toxin-antitoxin system RelE/ParE family toxin [Pedobacter steynii]AOM77171.1 hypothetical protein BFS30_08350 [Pedobacter steynii]
MSLSIFYTPTAKETLTAVYSFIEGKFGRHSADKFLLKAERTIAVVGKQPFLFRASAIDTQIRIALVTKQCSLFYLVRDSSVHLLFFWDNRQEPI